ncbi:g6959 [Coccomyxa viridis]|uniref:G6959 protein n=1 Tax=Coccomyxa viridis TaxID=1274662 RepID=A0ABP1G1G9_9CHLO
MRQEVAVLVMKIKDPDLSWHESCAEKQAAVQQMIASATAKGKFFEDQAAACRQVKEAIQKLEARASTGDAC